MKKRKKEKWKSSSPKRAKSLRSLECEEDGRICHGNNMKRNEFSDNYLQSFTVRCQRAAAPCNFLFYISRVVGKKRAAKINVQLHKRVYFIYMHIYICALHIHIPFLSAEVTFERDHFSRLTKDEKSFNAPPWYRGARGVLTPTSISTTSIKAKWAPGYEALTRDKYFRLIEVLTEVVVWRSRIISCKVRVRARYDRLNNALLNELAMCISFFFSQKLATSKSLKRECKSSWINLRKFIYEAISSCVIRIASCTVFNCVDKIFLYKISRRRMCR